MKVLNLDSLARTVRTLTIAGVDYEVQEMTVENFIETDKAAAKLKKDAPLHEQIDASINMILRSIPTLTEADLKRRPLAQLSTILKFINGELDEAKSEPEQNGEEVDSEKK